jgi:asparagine synthase (glutamine-hydrolysing)
MCGIVGGFGIDIQENWIKLETDNLEKRGPDHRAMLVVNSHLTMGAARLAMTDPLPRSNQPFVREDLGAIISFNGEIYNYKSLRNELVKDGYAFHTDSDTEVLLAAIHSYGEQVTEKINGMYAFAYYSKDTNQLILGRDFLGKKPLYWMKFQNNIYWSSSLQSLSRLKKARKLSSQGLIEYLSFGYTIDPSSIENEINVISPGTLMRVSLEGNAAQYQLLDSKPYAPESSNPLLTIREEITNAVTARISGHKSAAISMSGGLDSSIVAQITSRSEVDMTAYSAIWADSDKSRYNKDAEIAKVISSRIGIPCTLVEMITTDKLTLALDDFVLAMEEPNANPTGISMMSLYKAIGDDGHRLVLTGDGSDEIFGGYPRYESQSRIPKILSLRGNTVGKLLSSERSSTNNKWIAALLSQTDDRNSNRWTHWHWNFTPGELSRLIRSNQGQAHIVNQVESSISSSLNAGGKHRIERMMEMDRNIWLTMESNRKLDRISMHNSIEARSPFQDDRVIAVGLNEMAKHKFKKIEKKILWEAFPEMQSLGVRPDKTGFISPVGHWLRGNQKLASDSVDHLHLMGHFNIEHMKKLLSAPADGNYRKIMQLWSLIVLSRWILSNE